jgi:hypothetical protein
MNHRRLVGIDLGIATAHTVRVLDGEGTVVAKRKAWPTVESLTAVEAAALAGCPADTRLEVVIEPTGPVLDNLAATLNAMEQAHERIQAKYDAARKILTGRAFDHGTAPFQDFNNLMKLRDGLVHPRHLDRTTARGHTEPASSVVRDLQQRGLTRTRGRRRGDPLGGMSWLSEIYCGRTAAWAHKAACDVIVEVIRALPTHKHLWAMTSFRNWLASPAAQAQNPVTK